jgi:CDP-diacylglycerol--glycerol-3-phosphate 3-phosphatidyltransferase
MSAHPSPGTGLTLATKITLLRIAGIPVFVGLVVYYLHGLSAGVDDSRLRFGALVMFVLIAATDALDGYIARSRNQITRIGKVLDPLADKTLLLSALIMLTRPSMPQLAPHIPLWFTILLISRDAGLIVGYFLIHHFTGHVEVQPRLMGKLSTALTMLAICWVLMQKLDASFDWFIAIAGICTAISSIQYFVDAARQLGKVEHH